MELRELLRQMKATSLRWNLIANFGGQGWRALMAVLLVPFYVRLLGVEAYGLIGLYAGLQLSMALLDAGLRPTLAREMARFTGGAMDATAIRTLLRSVELPLMAMAAFGTLAVVLAAPWLANHWVNPQHIGPVTVAHAFMVMGLVAGLQLVESAYDSCLAGLQRQVLQNVIVTAVATLRGFGALAVLWFSPQVSSFFAWQACVALVSLTALRMAVSRSLPPADGQVRFSLARLREIRSYALGMFAIALVALLLTQSDRLVIARLLPLSDLGHYAIAAALAWSLAFLAGPVGGVYFSRLTELVERGDQPNLAIAFHRATSLTALLTGTATAMFALFGERLLRLWLQDPALAEQAAPLLALLVLGCMFSALATLPYLLQQAHGQISVTLWLGLGQLVAYIPALYFMVVAHGAVGAAACWAVLNLVGLLAGAALTFRRFLRREARQWWLNDVGAKLAAAFGSAALLRAMAPSPASQPAEIAVLTFAGTLILAAGVLADSQLRTLALNNVGLRFAR